MSCNCNHGCVRNKCNRTCACPVPYLGIEQLADNISVLRFNINGMRTDYDFSNLIYQVQSDTSLQVNAVKRVLQYMAERHMDSISAQELGSVLHLADLGDVSTRNAQDGSMLVYNQGDNCGNGCYGTGASWSIWNALDSSSIKSSATYPMVFGNDGKPRTLQQPQNSDQFYLLAWNGKNQLSYAQIDTVSASSVVGTDGKKIALYLDPQTRAIVGVKE